MKRAPDAPCRFRVPASPARSQPPWHIRSAFCSLRPCTSGNQPLIANVELEFRLTPLRISQIQISNRERMAPPHLGRADSGVRDRATRPLPLATGLLIVTPRVEFRTTHRKQSLSRSSNRYKSLFFLRRFAVANALCFAIPNPVPLTLSPAFPIIAGFFPRVFALVGGSCTAS